MMWRVIEEGANRLVDAGFDRLTRPRKSREQREKELEKTIAALEKEEAQAAPTTAPPSSAPALSGTEETPTGTREAPRGTGCAPCTSDHLSTCSGALAEAMRFARVRGVQDEEVQSRLSLCVDELNIWERVDAAPEKLVGLAPAEKEFLRRWLPKGRDLRHRVNEAETLEDLEGAAALARQQSVEARKEMRQLRPPVMKKIEALAEKVKAGGTSNKEALGELTEWWRKRQVGEGRKGAAAASEPSLERRKMTGDSPRLIGPTERREVPEEIKYFPDTPEQCGTSVDRTALRPQLDAAFVKAIARAKERR